MKIGEGTKIGGKRKNSTDQVGIGDELVVTVKHHCTWTHGCTYLVKDDLRYVYLKTLHDRDQVWALNPDGTETQHTVSVYINWDGEGRLSSRETGKSLNIKTLRRACPGCGQTVHSWREEDKNGSVAKADLQEGQP